MEVSNKFFSFKELDDAIKRYGNESLQCFVKRDSCTIDSWLKQQKNQITIDEKVKADIVYQKVIYKCIHHKKEDFKSKGKSVRLECAYNGKDCKVAINVSF